MTVEDLEKIAEEKRKFNSYFKKLKEKVKLMSNEEINKKIKEIKLNLFLNADDSIATKTLLTLQNYELNIYRSELKRRNLNG